MLGVWKMKLIMKATELKPSEAKDGENIIFERKYDGSRHIIAKGNIISSREIIRNDRYSHILKHFKDIDAVID